jgi:hypothetical protein
VTEVSWSRCGGEDCIRLSEVASGARVVVRVPPAHMVGQLPPMAGRVVADRGDVCFVPRYAFVEGTTYSAVVDGVALADLTRLRPDRSHDTEVVGISPTAAEVPRNLLRLYVSFSAPMSEGRADRHVRLVDDAGDEILRALLPMDHELWDGARRRLTVLLDPARIKRGLVGHRESGYPLRPGTSFRLLVDSEFPDARGVPLRTGAERRYAVGDDERRRVDPQDWALSAPTAGTSDELRADFDRPLDPGLLARCLRVMGPPGDAVEGTGRIGPEGRSWCFSPLHAWTPRPHALVVDPALEDLAGNSVVRVFDRDVTRAADEPRDGTPVILAFEPR